MSIENTEVGQLFDQDRYEAPGRPRWIRVTIVTIVILAIVAALAVWADGAARATAEDAVEQEIASRLPDGAGPITADIGGFAFLPQLLSGHLQQVDIEFAISAPNILSLTGADPGAVTISDSVISHDGSVEFFGMTIGYTVTLEPSVDDGVLVLTPSGIEASTDVATVDLGQLVDLDALAMNVCAAELLPQSMTLTRVEVAGSHLLLSVTGRDVPIDIAELKARGSCD